MSDNQEPENGGGGNGGGNPWMKSLMIWGGIFLALLLAVSLFGGPREAPGTAILYSDFKDKVAEGSVAEVQIAPDRISGVLKNEERFTTTPVPGDVNLTTQLEDAGVEYTGTQPEQMNVLLVVLIQALPFLLILGIAFFALRQVQKGGGAGGAMGFGKSKAKLLTEKQGRVTFDDVAGIDEAREELQEIVEFLKDPQRFSKLGGQIPKGALLVGSPGTGKTLLARAIAGEARVPFFTISGSDFVEMFVGVGASRVRDMFEQVRLDVLEKTLQRQEPMNLSRLQRRSSDIKIGSWVLPGDDGAPSQDRPALRQALVFSNEYRDSDGLRLPNTMADGEKVATSLLSSGYETIHVRNSDRGAFQDAVAGFQDRLRAAGPAAVGLVYFAGYGTSLEGENYLIPDGPIPYDTSGVREEAIKLADLVTQLETAMAQAIIVLVDCGRPFRLGGQKGIEPGFSESFGRDKVVIAYADAPGEQHDDGAAESRFAGAFARNVLSEDRIDIEAVMRRVSEDVRDETGGQQRPWFQTSLELPIFFRADIVAPVEPLRKTRNPYRKR